MKTIADDANIQTYSCDVDGELFTLVGKAKEKGVAQITAP